MKLYVEPMDAVVVEVDDHGRIRLQDAVEWSVPTLQERRAILYAAASEIASLQELIERLQGSG
jgi:hypothetical protein